MISPEILRRYPFFAGLDLDQIKILAEAAEEMRTDTDEVIFKEGDMLVYFYLVLEGAVAIVINLPDQEARHTVSGQLTGELETKEVVVSTVGTGDVFGWSSLIPPHEATAGAKSVTPGRVVRFNVGNLHKQFEKDPEFGYQLTVKAAQVIRDRLRDMRIESLAFIS